MGSCYQGGIKYGLLVGIATRSFGQILHPSVAFSGIVPAFSNQLDVRPRTLSVFVASSIFNSTVLQSSFASWSFFGYLLRRGLGTRHATPTRFHKTHTMGSSHSVPAVYDKEARNIAIMFTVLTTFAMAARITSGYIKKAKFGLDDAFIYTTYVRTTRSGTPFRIVWVRW